MAAMLKAAAFEDEDVFGEAFAGETVEVDSNSDPPSDP